MATDDTGKDSAAAPFCMINPKAGKRAFTAFLLRDGIFWAAKADPKAVRQANGWLESWGAQAESLRLERIQRISGTLDAPDMTLACAEDDGSLRQLRVILASHADRDLMLSRLLAQLGDWPEVISFESRGLTVAKGVFAFAGCLGIAWFVAALTAGSFKLPEHWNVAVQQQHGGRGSFLAQVAVAFAKAIGPTVGEMLAWAVAGLGLVCLLLSFFARGEAVFDHHRPAPAQAGGTGAA